MCMEDVRIGRATDSEMVAASVGTAMTKVLNKNPRRFGLIISSSKTQDVYLANTQLGTATNGILILAASSPLKLTIKHDGDIVRGDIWLAAPGGAVTVGVIETVFYEAGLPAK